MYRLLVFPLLLSLFCTCDRAESGTQYAVEKYDGPMAESVPGYVDGDYSLDEDIEIEPPRTAEPPPPPPPPSGQQQAQRPKTAPKVIYTASARARVENLDSALVQVTRAITAAGGYLSSQHRTNTAYEHEARLQIRLPAERLNTTLALLPTIAAQIDYQNLDSRDVTAEWLDLETRLQTKRDVRDRYIDILRNRAQKVEDILNAEDKIRVITEEIESKEGRLRYLRDQVSLSTLTLELYETQEYRDTGNTYKRSCGS
ncbi:MAG: DUF4349 domain-containing protein, partial [Bacteroidota bacterium]